MDEENEDEESSNSFGDTSLGDSLGCGLIILCCFIGFAACLWASKQ